MSSMLLDLNWWCEKHLEDDLNHLLWRLLRGSDYLEYYYDI